MINAFENATGTFLPKFFVKKTPFTQKQTEIDKTYLEEEINHFDSRLTLLLINWKFFMMHSKKIFLYDLFEENSGKITCLI